MIEATCTTCGTVNRIADADVPVGAKFVNCASCKSRVAFATTSAARAPAPRDALDLADLPAPRRNSPLTGEVGKPAQRSGLAAAHTEPELPAPRNKKPIAPPPGPGGALDLDDLLVPPDGGADLLAPRPAGMRSSADLPAPKTKNEPVAAPRSGHGRAMTDLPVPGIADTSPLADLPAPKSKGGPPIADLPAPRPKAPLPAMPRPPVAAAPPPQGITDLPGPKAKGITDLPGPKPKGVPSIPAVPPMAAKPGPGPMPGIVDLPKPKQPAGIVDLPMPKPGQVGDLPMPKPGQAGDLPAPKGFFDDLPQPARGGANPRTTDVAPKGFFDDLPQPAKPASQGTATNDVAPKGFFDDLPGRPTQQKAEVPAPKGFFDDLPGRPTQQKAEVPAPKGFFDDLPGRPTQQNAEVPAPKGLFDDLPKPSAAKSSDIELDSLDLDPPEDDITGIELDIDGPALELAEDEPAAPPPARIKQPSIAPAPGPSNQFDDLDLSVPSPVSFAKGGMKQSPHASGAGVATINPAAAAAAAAAMRPALPPLGGPRSGGDVGLELEEPRNKQPTASPTSKLGPKQREEQRQAKAQTNKQTSARRRKVVGIALVGALALGGGGYFAYRHFAQKAEHEAAVGEQLSAARKAIAVSQWQKASSAATKTLELDKKNAEALGIRAEALFALGIVEGNNPGRIGQGRKTLTDALESGLTHPSLDRARALSPLAANQPNEALPKLNALAAKAPKDGSIQLYLGWAHAGLGDYESALKSFDAAAATPALKGHALLGRARAKQARGDLEGARADYAAVLETIKDHIGAQIGLASTLEASKIQQQEADLLAILAIKDVEKREPQAAMQAWILVAELARKSGRLDVARERYRKALAISATDVASLTGLAEVELRDGKLEVAAEMIDKALKAAPTDLHAQLVALEIAIAKKQLDDAAKRLDAIIKRTPPPPVIDQAKIKLLEARLLEAQGKEQDSIEAYLEAAKLAGKQDLTPTLVAAQVLTKLAAKYEAANDLARASELRKKAEQLLGELSDEAQKDPTLALTLGMAYLEANDAVKAETWLRKAIEMQPQNVDAMYQLAKALTKQGGKDAEAIIVLRNAVELDPTRTEIGIELARTYEEAKPPRAIEAEKLYDKLLAAKEPTLELRARAGKFYARIGQMEKAGAQGVEILKAQDDHPAGLYLKGEGLLATNKTESARKLFVQASDADQQEPQFQDARGRASEMWARESGNSTYQDDAIRSYSKAVELDPTVFASWLGLGRLYVLRNEDAKALDPLQKAWALKQTAEVARLLGIALKNIGNQPQNAAGWLEQSFRLEENADTAWYLGMLYTDAKLNNPKAAMSALERATRLAGDAEKKSGHAPPWFDEALYNLGDIRRAQYDLRGAKEAWQKWLGRNPKSSAKRKEVEQMMATSLKDL
ncbi:MAG: tetratricopeptide repeat protein [Myxococcota bacterium]|nr:tetratricopeptide repeat protein [Myxococcota bacterium]